MNSIRIIYQGIHSKPKGGSDYVVDTVYRITWPAIHSNSIVLMAASEVDIEYLNARRFVGNAPIMIENIAPGNGYADFRINVDWESPINVAVDVVVLDSPETMVIVSPDFQDQQTVALMSTQSYHAQAFLASHLSNEHYREYQNLLITDETANGIVTTHHLKR